MKAFFFIITISILLSACIQSTKSDNRSVQAQERSEIDLFAEADIDQDSHSTTLSNLFSLADAEKIMGQPATLIDSSTQNKSNVIVYQSGYKTNAEDIKTRKTGAVYFLVERYNSISSAQKKYTFIKKANEDHEGIKVLNDLGDEGYFHSDGKNFYFIMVRKGISVFNIKVNKITSFTSLDEFNLVAKRIAANL